MYHLPTYLPTIQLFIAYTVSQLGQFNANPGPEHWKAVKHLFRYLKATVDFKLTYAPNPSSKELFSVYTQIDKESPFPGNYKGILN